MNFIEELGTMALGSRVKILSEMLMKDVSRIYKEMDLDFEPRWFTFFQLVLRNPGITVTEIARELNQTHPAAVQVINSLVKKKLVRTKKDKTDQRKRLVSLTKKGKDLSEELEAVWEAVHQSAREILKESDPKFIEHIARVEKALKKKNTYDRIRGKLQKGILGTIEFIPYDNKYNKEFRELNEDWLRTYLDISDHDKHILTKPEKEIIAKNGHLFLMTSGSRIIGTYALQKINDSDCELSKFTVKKAYRGMKLGEKMMAHAIEEATRLGYKTIVLHSHHKLKEATNLYSKLGFKTISGHPGLIDKSGRCSLVMKLNIHQ
jgi:DNA-binding MarR family transcriptional regulator/ribosomal protein S18 acetylase RimI-like enzyme